MKKIITIFGLVASSSVFAVDSFTISTASVDNANKPAQTQYSLVVRKDLADKLTADVGMWNTQTDGTGALGTRLETGLTVSQKYENFDLYLRSSVGKRYTNTKDFSYYAIEPGVRAKLGQSGFTASVGYRYRSAFDSDTFNDQTQTMRYGLSYALTKKDSVGVRYDRVSGDSDQRTVNLNYTRAF